jgi:hypothetical protein
MCCALTLLLLLSPRVLLLLTWLFDPFRVNAAFSGSFFLPCLGFIFLPWTTLFYVWLWVPLGGINGFAWIIIGLGLFFDIGSLMGGLFGNRRRVEPYVPKQLQ